MAIITLIGLHIGKHAFHLVGHDAQGNSILKRQFSRRQLIGFLPGTRGPHRDGSLLLRPLAGA
jgi:hypothetical protein